jgi:cytidylate kinase
MGASVICVSRSSGARGEEIARLVAERVGFRYVDDGILTAAAEAGGLYPEAVSEAEMRGVGRLVEVDFHRFEQTEKLRELIREAIAQTAADGSVVIVAHAASFALDGQARPDGVLRVFVTASTETRLDRVAGDERLDPKSAAKLVADSDLGRREYLKRFYGVKDELPTHYDLVVNTDRLSVEQAAETIARAAAADS